RRRWHPDTAAGETSASASNACAVGCSSKGTRATPEKRPSAAGRRPVSIPPQEKRLQSNYSEPCSRIGALVSHSAVPQGILPLDVCLRGRDKCPARPAC